MGSIDRYRTLSVKYPDANWLGPHGGLTWDAADASNEIAAVFAHQQDLGYDALHLSASEIAAVTPGIDASTVTSRERSSIQARAGSIFLR